jgi:hypothetical protein
MWYQHDGCTAHNAIVALKYLIEYTLDVGLVVVDQELGTIVLLTSHPPLDFFMGNSKGQYIPGCSTTPKICGNVLLTGMLP